jgi:hypothetical protein
MAKLFAGTPPNTSGVPNSAMDEERMRALIETLGARIEHYHGGAVEMVSFDGEVQFFPGLKKIEATYGHQASSSGAT